MPKRDPRRHPKPGDRLARVLRNRTGMSRVYSRMVVALEARYPRGVIVVYARKRITPHCLQRCTLTAWRRWAGAATIVAQWTKARKRL